MRNNTMEYDVLASREVVEKTVKALEGKGYEVFLVENGKEAMAKIKELIPKGVSVMNGSSATLKEIGFIDYLKAREHGWNNLHEYIVKEVDEEKKKRLRKQALLSDYYLGSVHALVENGEFVIASNSGSQLPHVVYSSSDLIFVVGIQKIVKSLDQGMERLENYVYPLEDASIKRQGGEGSGISKVVIFKAEKKGSGRRVRFILVNEKLGF